MKKIWFIFFVIFIFACQEKNPFKIDVSNISVNVDIQRFDKDLFHISTDSIERNIPFLQKKYGTFFDIFNYQIIKIGGTNEREYASRMREFRYYCHTYKIQEEVDKNFPNLDEVKSQLISAFQHYKYYFPEKNIPKIYTMISAFNQSVVILDSAVAISLDKYLGQNCQFYKDLAYENYRRMRMHKGKIACDVLQAIAETEFSFNDSTNNLLNTMIHKGKIMYFLHSMFPETADTILWDYSEKQYRWCEKYEGNIWKYLVEKKVLFINNTFEIRKYTEEAPFTAAFANVSAPRAGVWVGFKIVKAFMKQNSKISLKNLMMEQDYQKILNFSRYKP